MTLPNHVFAPWGRLVAITASIYLLWSALWAIAYRKFAWDMIGSTQMVVGEGIVPPPQDKFFLMIIINAPIVQILQLISATLVLLVEIPLTHIEGSAIHRSVLLKVIGYPIVSFLAVLTYQGLNAALYFLVSTALYATALHRNESVIEGDAETSSGRGHRSTDDTKLNGNFYKLGEGAV